MIATLDIVWAAIVGVLIAATFEGRPVAVILATPAVALAQAMLLLVAPSIEASEASPVVRAVVSELADPLLLIAVVVASGTGAMVTTFLLRRAKGSAEPAFWLPDMDTRSGSRRRAAPAASGRAPDAMRRLDSLRARNLVEEGYSGRVPVFAVDQAPANPAAALGGQLTPPPRPGLKDALVNMRASGRRRTLLAGFLETDAGVSINCSIKNLSVGGAQVRVDPDVPLVGTIHLIDITNGLGHECRVSWRSGPNAGLRFAASYDLRRPPNPRAAALARLWSQLAPR